MIIKIIISVLVLFFISRVYLRFRDGSLSLLAFIIWVLLWSGITFFTWWPRFSDFIANKIGVGRGVDVLVYFSIIFLFYSVFRIYIKLEFIEHEITSLVRNIAYKQKRKNKNEDINNH
ncbi:MAG: DUF2304 family protein [Patescibacteria group bacterium]|nr:DUF2304 family protein [Patescibacteria group bacterium]